MVAAICHIILCDYFMDAKLLPVYIHNFYHILKQRGKKAFFYTFPQKQNIHQNTQSDFNKIEHLSYSANCKVEPFYCVNYKVEHHYHTICKVEHSYCTNRKVELGLPNFEHVPYFEHLVMFYKLINLVHEDVCRLVDEIL